MYMEEKQELFGHLQDARNEKDLSQKDAAKHLQIAQNTLSQYERGQRNVPNEILIRMAQLYGVTTDYLLGITNRP